MTVILDSMDILNANELCAPLSSRTKVIMRNNFFTYKSKWTYMPLLPFRMIAFGYEVEGNARLISNHPGVTPWCNFECVSRLYLRFVSKWIFDHHTTGDDVADVIFRILTHLWSGMQRPLPAGLIRSKSNDSGSKICIGASAAVNKYSHITSSTRIFFNYS